MSEIETNEVIEQAPEELLASVEAQAPEHTQIQDAAPPVAAPEEYSITVGGKEIKAPMDKLIKWASMGYDAPNKIGQLNRELESWKKREAELNAMDQRYKTVDEYVKQNPQWFQFIQQQYEKQQAQGLGQDHPLLQELNSLKTTVNDLAQYKNNIVTQQEDTAYNEELDSIKKAYPKVDFNTPDESGKSLEYKILEHAQQNGIRSFKTAYRDFYHDEIIKMKAEEAKENVIKDKVAKSKLGVLGTSPVPTTKATYTKDKSWNQLADDIIKEHNLT